MGDPSQDVEVNSQHGLDRLTPSMICDTPDFDVKDSSFFNKWRELPSPEQVRERATAQWIAGTSLDKRKVLTYGGKHMRPSPTVFEDLGLVVKWGVQATILEAQSVYAVHSLLKDRVPVPEIYGWRTDGEEKFIYMQFIQGQTLEKVWDSLEVDERHAVCLALHTIIKNLRQLEQDPLDPFIGSVIRSHFHDRVIPCSYLPEAGPFTSVHEFHEWFVYLCRRPMPDPHSVPIEPFRHELSDDSAIKFTHGDLHPSNIIITTTKPYHVLAIVDWEQSGWLPEYWEARKAQYTSGSKEWSTKYLPIILDQYPSTEDPWECNSRVCIAKPIPPPTPINVILKSSTLSTALVNTYAPFMAPSRNKY